VNVYEEDDCIPPHIDHHDFMRPFCTISLLSEEEIMFGSRLVPSGSPGVFHNSNGPYATLPLPTGNPPAGNWTLRHPTPPHRYPYCRLLPISPLAWRIFQLPPFPFPPSPLHCSSPASLIPCCMLNSCSANTSSLAPPPPWLLQRGLGILPHYFLQIIPVYPTA